MATAKRLPSGNWNIRIGTGKGGKAKSFTAPTKKEVELLAAQYSIEQKKPDVEKTVGQLIEDYIDLKRNILSPTTIAGYEKIKRCDIGNISFLRACDITEQMIQKWVNTLAACKSSKTVHNAFGLLSAVLSMYLPERRFRISLPPKKKQYRDFPQPQEIVDAFRGTEIEIPVLLALWLGLRMSEIRGIRKKDIKNGILTITKTIVTVNGEHVEKDNTKTFESARQLRVPPYLQELIAALPEAREHITELSGQAIYKRFSRGLEKAGLQHIRFHDLRHLNASVMLSLGIPDKLAMERGGWSTPSIMRSVYQHTFTADRTAADDKIDAYFSSFFDNNCNKNCNEKSKIP